MRDIFDVIIAFILVMLFLALVFAPIFILASMYR